VLPWQADGGEFANVIVKPRIDGLVKLSDACLNNHGAE
jgi:hypothetical protein